MISVALLGIKCFTARKKSSSSDPSRMIECYASIKLPSLQTANIAAVGSPPTLPSGQRHRQYSMDENPSYKWVGDDGVYWNEGEGPGKQPVPVSAAVQLPSSEEMDPSGLGSPTATEQTYLEVMN